MDSGIRFEEDSELRNPNGVEYERANNAGGSMQNIIQMECSQTWTIAFAVSLVFTIVIGILLLLYCIMYRKHIKFLIYGPPPIPITKNKPSKASASGSVEKLDMESSNTESRFGEVSVAGPSMMTMTGGNTSMMTGAGGTNETNQTGTVINNSNMSILSQV